MNAIEGSDGSTANLEAELEELIKEAAEDFKKQEKVWKSAKFFFADARPTT